MTSSGACVLYVLVRHLMGLAGCRAHSDICWEASLSCQSHPWMMVIPNSAVTRGVIFAPLGRDAAVTSQLLAKAGIPAVVCDDLPLIKAAHPSR